MKVAGASQLAAAYPGMHANDDDDVHVCFQDEVAWMMAMSAPGFAAGSLVTRFVADRLGRRATVLTSAVPFAVGSLVVSFALKPWLLYLTRFLWGIGTGMASTVIPMYLAEVVDKEVRATLSLFTRVTFNLGNLLVMTIGVFVTYDYLNNMLLVLPITYLIMCYWIPESPYYYLKDGRMDAAKKELMKIRRCKEETELEDELKRLQKDVSSEMRRSSSVKELFTGKQYRRAIIIAAGLKLTQTMTGVMTIRGYLGRINEQSKSTLELKTVLLVFGVVQFGIMSSIIADRVGRRPLLYYSLFGNGLCLAIVSVYFYYLEVIQMDPEVLSAYCYVPFGAIIGANVIATLGYNSIIMVIPAEIFPMNVKAVALTSLSMFGGLIGFGMGKGYQEIVNLAGLLGAFSVFTGFSVAGALFVMYYVPETKGKSLKEIQIILQGDIYNEAENDTLNQVKESEVNEVVENNELKEVNLSLNNVKV
ncbi:hypothetical protein MSG28_004009 [Choristoneura fumiferana]|uniref:Uncharacterized protein n=1 Tax=Choristoneura fumiferana TaxID=7141 RepID=A0ACC0KH36_CHOFU|nr:hypothetical protein MSG28_004009 [Choristoneura fumiferana]